MVGDIFCVASSPPEKQAVDDIESDLSDGAQLVLQMRRDRRRQGLKELSHEQIRALPSFPGRLKKYTQRGRRPRKRAEVLWARASGLGPRASGLDACKGFRGCTNCFILEDSRPISVCS